MSAVECRPVRRLELLWRAAVTDTPSVIKALLDIPCLAPNRRPTDGLGCDDVASAHRDICDTTGVRLVRSED